MTQKEKMFEVDYQKKKFTMIIEICENGSILSIKNESGYCTNYHEVIGALETQKHAIMDKQKLINRSSESFKKNKKEKKVS